VVCLKNKNKKKKKLKYQHPKPLHIAWMMNGNAEIRFEQPLNMLLGKITGGIVAM